MNHETLLFSIFLVEFSYFHLISWCDFIGYVLHVPLKMFNYSIDIIIFHIIAIILPDIFAIIWQNAANLFIDFFDVLKELARNNAFFITFIPTGLSYLNSEIGSSGLIWGNSDFWPGHMLFFLFGQRFSRYRTPKILHDYKTNVIAEFQHALHNFARNLYRGLSTKTTPSIATNAIG